MDGRRGADEGQPETRGYPAFESIRETGAVRPTAHRGQEAVEAYREVYGEVKGAEVSASRLLSFAKVKERIHALQQIAALDSLMTRDEKRRFLKRVVFTSIGRVDKENELCQSYKQRNTETGTEQEYKMPDKLRAIELDSKLAGELKETHEHRHELDDGLIELLARIGAAGA